jgi:hypothetical protein
MEWNGMEWNGREGMGDGRAGLSSISNNSTFLIIV